MAERISTWEHVELPIGPQSLPSWLKNMAVDWHDGYMNWPTLAIKVDHNVHDWPDQRWEQHGALFATKHLDGRAKFLSHAGTIAMTTLKRTTGNGTPEAPWICEEYQGLATSQQQGFAGRATHIVMAEGHRFAGREVALRGPWFGGRLPGFNQITTFEPNPERDQFWIRRGKPWNRRSGGCFGLFISDDLLIRAFARFLPHLRLVRCSYSFLDGVSIFEPLKPEWDEPKRWIDDREYAAAQAARKAA